MEQQKYELLMLSSQSGERQLGKLISFLFSNENLYVNAPFRRLVQQDRKGYVPISELLKNDVIQNYLRELQLYDVPQQIIFLKTTVNYFCPELFFSDSRVRRLDPWSAKKLKNLKPIALTGLKERMSISDIRDYFGECCFITTTDLPVENTGVRDRAFLVYGEDTFEKKNDLMDREDIPFTVLSYENLCKDRSRDSRLWDNDCNRAYRPLEYDVKSEERMEYRTSRDFPDYEGDYQFKRARNFMHREIEDNQARTHRRQADKNLFNSLAKSPNLSFNSMLRGFMTSWALQGGA